MSENGAEALKMVEWTSETGQVRHRNYRRTLLWDKAVMTSRLISVTSGTSRI